jgi:hypothetical protein
MLLKGFWKGTSEDIEGAEMSLIASSHFLALPVGGVLISNGDWPMICGTQTVAWWYAKKSGIILLIIEIYKR